MENVTVDELFNKVAEFHARVLRASTHREWGDFTKARRRLQSVVRREEPADRIS